jgi:hypothetical protein
MPVNRSSRPVTFFVLLLAVSAILGVIPAYDRALAYPVLAGILLTLSLYFVPVILVQSWNQARHWAMVLVVIAALVSLYFILQYPYDNPDPAPEFIHRLGLITALPDLGLPKFLVSNQVAGLAIGFLVVAASLIITTRRVLSGIVISICVLVLMYAVLLTFSRGALVALAVGLVLTIVLAVRRRPLLLIPVVVVLAVGVVVVYRLTMNTSAFDWASDRYELYQNSLIVAQDYFFTGIGLGSTFSLVYSQFGLMLQVPFLNHPHNLLLVIWMGQGLLGLIALVGLVLTFYLLIFNTITFAVPRRLFFGLMIGTTVVLVHNLFDAVLTTPFILMGLTVATGWLSFIEAHANGHAPVWLRLPQVGAVVLLVGVVAAGAIFFQPLQAAWYTNLGALGETRSQYAPGLTEAERMALNTAAVANYDEALAINPQSANANRRLGNLYLSLGEYDQAVAYLETAYALDSTLLRAHLKSSIRAVQWLFDEPGAVP